MNKYFHLNIIISGLLIPLSQAMEDDGTYSFSDNNVSLSQKRKRAEAFSSPEEKGKEKCQNEDIEPNKKSKTDNLLDDNHPDYDSYSHSDLITSYLNNGDRIAKQTLKKRICKGLINKGGIKNLNFSNLGQSERLSSLKLFLLLTFSGVDKQSEALSNLIQKEAAKKKPMAFLNVGFCHFTGVGVDKDVASAAQWLLKAAEQEYAPAQHNLGGLYARGIGVANDFEQAFQWIQKAAEQGHALAQFNLAVIYAKGSGVEKDLAKAFEWYQRAAAQGHALSQCSLGDIYVQGEGVEKELVKAIEWYIKAASQGDAVARSNLKDYFPGQDLTNSAQLPANGSGQLELTPDKVKNIKYFKQNLTELSAHLLLFHAISHGNFVTTTATLRSRMRQKLGAICSLF